MSNISVGSLVDGRFQVIAYIDAGGFGAVLRVQDTMNSAECALKYCTQEPEYRRFGREVRILQGLKHANVVSVLHANVDHDPPYLVMPIASSSVRPELRIGPMEEARAIATFRQVCEGVAAIHRSGATHRDLKPENILIMSDGTVVVSDLGSARFEERDTTILTATLSLVGTWEYASPEQIRGNGRNADRRTDIYQLGKVLYEFLTGDTPSAMDLAPLPRALRQIIERATRRRPDDRFQQVADLVADLDAYLAAKNPAANPVESLERLLAEADALLVDEHYDAANVRGIVDTLLVLTDRNELGDLRIYFDRVPKLLYSIMVTSDPAKLAAVLDGYASSQASLGASSNYPYADAVAARMRLMVRSSKATPSVKAAALRALLISAVYLNRYDAMDEFAELVMELTTAQDTTAVATMLTSQRGLFQVVRSRIVPSRLHGDLRSVYAETAE